MSEAAHVPSRPELLGASPADFEAGGDSPFASFACGNLPFGGPHVPGLPATRAMATEKTWKPGAKLRVLISSRGDAWSEQVARAVREIAPLWTESANLTFDFVDASPAHIHVNVSWLVPGMAPSVPTYNCFHGTDCVNQGIVNGLPSMNLLFSRGRTDEFRRVILHEFGHALGLMHEHIRPDRPLRWNEAQVIRSYTRSQGWSAETVRAQIIDAYRPDRPVDSLRGTAFDLKSIMMYPFDRLADGTPMAVFDDGTPFVTGLNTELTPLDKILAAMLYPFPGDGDPAEQPLDVGGAAVSGAVDRVGRVARYRFVPRSTLDHVVAVDGMPALVALHRERGKSTGRTLGFETDGSPSTFRFRVNDPGEPYYLEVRHAKPTKGTGAFRLSVASQG